MSSPEQEHPVYNCHFQRWVLISDNSQAALMVQPCSAQIHRTLPVLFCLCCNKPTQPRFQLSDVTIPTCGVPHRTVLPIDIICLPLSEDTFIFPSSPPILCSSDQPQTADPPASASQVFVTGISPNTQLPLPSQSILETFVLLTSVPFCNIQQNTPITVVLIS